MKEGFLTIWKSTTVVNATLLIFSSLLIALLLILYQQLNGNAHKTISYFSEIFVAFPATLAGVLWGQHLADSKKLSDEKEKNKKDLKYYLGFIWNEIGLNTDTVAHLLTAAEKINEEAINEEMIDEKSLEHIYQQILYLQDATKKFKSQRFEAMLNSNAITAIDADDLYNLLEESYYALWRIDTYLTTFGFNIKKQKDNYHLLFNNPESRAHQTNQLKNSYRKLKELLKNCLEKMDKNWELVGQKLNSMGVSTELTLQNT